MNEQEQTVASPWEGVEVIHSYSRAEAIEDGVLVDLTGWAWEAGFRIPVAVTRGVWEILKPSKELEAEGEDEVGRAWDMFTILLHTIRSSSKTDMVEFSPLFTRTLGHKPESVAMIAKCGPGDSGEPVITIMLPGED